MGLNLLWLLTARIAGGGPRPRPMGEQGRCFFRRIVVVHCRAVKTRYADVKVIDDGDLLVVRRYVRSDCRSEDNKNVLDEDKYVKGNFIFAVINFVGRRRRRR